MLVAHQIQVVVDNRSAPYSRFAPRFDREIIQKAPAKAGGRCDLRRAPALSKRAGPVARHGVARAFGGRAFLFTLICVMASLAIVVVLTRRHNALS